MAKVQWGGWELFLDKSDKPVLLSFEPDRHNYQIEFERCNTSAEVLDWIVQIKKKTWANDACLAGLVRALDDMLDLQATVVHRVTRGET
jgi:hypothetical protein